ncbi:MAG: DUF4132 domain-containing protein [Proteobacteria bacterium]|nr:DUF4132 domain-containing protein [Pseudomonadota bacterium]
MPHATVDQLALIVLNADYGSTVRDMAELLPATDELADAILRADRAGACRHGEHMAVILLGRAGRLAEAPEIVAATLAKQTDKEFVQVYAPELARMPGIDELLAPMFDVKIWNRARWSLIPACGGPKTLARACSEINKWPRGEPYERDHALKAFRALPESAAAPLLKAWVPKKPQRDILVVGMAATGSPLVADKLIECLADSSSKVVDAAVEGLIEVGDASKVEPLLTARKKAFRVGAARVMEKLSPSGEKARSTQDILTDLGLPIARRWISSGVWETFEAGLTDANLDDVELVLTDKSVPRLPALWRWYAGRKDPRVTPFCVKQASHSNAQVSDSALHALHNRGERDELVALLGSKKGGVRAEVTRILSEHPSAELAELMTRALAKEKSKATRAVMEATLEACLAASEVPIDELPLDATGRAELGARFARRPSGDADGLALAWSDGRALTPAELGGLLTALEDDAGLLAIRPNLDLESAGDLWQALREKHAHTREGRYGWVIRGALPVLARDRDLADLGRDLDERARGGDHMAAFAILESMAAHASSAGLQRVDHWARRARSNGLRERSGLALKRAARRLGITPDEIGERVLQDFGLDGCGARPWPHADREYGVRLGADLTPVLSLDGVVKKSLAGARTADDPAVIKTSKAEFSALKKQLRTAVKAAVERLEAAMVSGRQWSIDSWRTTYGANPVLSRLAQQLIWWDFATSTAFRVAEDGSFADRQDDEVTVAGPIGLAHPLRMDDAAAWAEVLEDYELIPPFAKLERSTTLPIGEEPTDRNVTRWLTRSVSSGAVRGVMARGRWVRGSPQDGGAVLWMTKAFPAAGVTAVLEFSPGLGMGYDYEENQELDELTFIAGVHSDRPHPMTGLLNQDVDAVVFSEVVGSIDALFAD